MKMLPLSVIGLAVLAASPVLAQSDIEHEVNRIYTDAGGQIDALAVVCGKISQSKAAAHRTELRREYTMQKGMSPAEFDSVYDGAYNSVSAKAAANPARFKQGCAQMEKLATGTLAK